MSNNENQIDKRGLLHMNYITNEYNCQLKSLFSKLQYHRKENAKSIEMFRRGNFLDGFDRIMKLEDCATQIGVLNDNGIPRIVRANFCRQRVCNICAWRRQVRFTQTLRPIMAALSADNYQFIFVTLTIENVSREDVSSAVDLLLSGYNNLLRRAVIKRAWAGVVRSVEITYNSDYDTYHPHIHALVAVTPSYFKHSNYITHKQLIELWRDCCGLDYNPSVRIQKTSDNVAAASETIKYALKPTPYIQALEVFFTQLKGRRLISFSGVFSRYKKLLNMPDFDTVLTDETPQENKTYDVYTLDPTGGMYTFYRTFYLKE